jgi:PPOX class probable F420-dependent enzyme
MDDMTTIPTEFKDLLDTGVATLATVTPGGYPQLTAVWFIVEDGDIRVSLNKSRAKYKFLLANPKATFFIIDPENTMRTLEVRGDALVEDDDDYAAADRVGAKYGADLRAFDAPGVGRAIVTIKATKVIATNTGS